MSTTRSLESLRAEVETLRARFERMLDERREERRAERRERTSPTPPSAPRGDRPAP